MYCHTQADRLCFQACLKLNNIHASKDVPLPMKYFGGVDGLGLVDTRPTDDVSEPPESLLFLQLSLSCNHFPSQLSM
jgi:hypothetical protein